jgi:hypothetical protein
MTRAEILSGYVDCHCPGITGYAYQATTWCVPCGKTIARRLVREWQKAGTLAAIDHYELNDTEKFPCPIVFEPTDYCDHCGTIQED